MALGLCVMEGICADGGSAAAASSADDHFETPIPGEWYFIRNKASGKVLNVDGAVPHGGRQEIAAHPHDGLYPSHRLFRLLDGGEGYFYIQNQESRKVLDVLHAVPHGGRQSVIAQPHDGDVPGYRLFKILDGGEGNFYIQNQGSRKVLNVDGASSSGGRQPVWAHPHDGAWPTHRLFCFIPGPELLVKRSLVTFIEKPLLRKNALGALTMEGLSVIAEPRATELRAVILEKSKEHLTHLAEEATALKVVDISLAERKAREAVEFYRSFPAEYHPEFQAHFRAQLAAYEAARPAVSAEAELAVHRGIIACLAREDS